MKFRMTEKSKESDHQSSRYEVSKLMIYAIESHYMSVIIDSGAHPIPLLDEESAPNVT